MVKGVGTDDVQSIRKRRDQTGYKIAVDLDRVQMIDAIEQQARERAFARAYFDERIGGCRRDGIHDALENPGVVQEVLTESFSGPHLSSRRNST